MSGIGRLETYAIFRLNSVNLITLRCRHFLFLARVAAGPRFTAARMLQPGTENFEMRLI